MSFTWEEFSESDKEYPEEIVNKTIEGFSKATKGLVELVVRKLDGTSAFASGLGSDFSFRIYLVSPILVDYRFKILDFGYDVKMTPIFYKMESEIHDEIYGTDDFFNSSDVRTIKNEDFVEELQKIFKTQIFIDLVSGLMKIASKAQTEF